MLTERLEFAPERDAEIFAAVPAAPAVFLLRGDDPHAEMCIRDRLKGAPVLLFFWAHWCGDCKAEAPIITQLRTEFAQGLTVLGPTRLYGYTAQVENAAPSDELAYIDAVRHRFYAGLLDMPVPISKYNFDMYGASTTPTLVLLDRTGKVAMYHPGALPYDQLKAEIEKVVVR